MYARRFTQRPLDAFSTVSDARNVTFRAVEPAPISEAVTHKLAQAFELTPHEVQTDAQQIVSWDQPGDDLLVWLERRHAWSAERALRYLVSVRSALAGELDAS